MLEHELAIADRRNKREIRNLEQELPKWQVLVDSVTGMEFWFDTFYIEFDRIFLLFCWYTLHLWNWEVAILESSAGRFVCWWMFLSQITSAVFKVIIMKLATHGPYEVWACMTCFLWGPTKGVQTFTTLSKFLYIPIEKIVSHITFAFFKSSLFFFFLYIFFLLIEQGKL